MCQLLAAAGPQPRLAAAGAGSSAAPSDPDAFMTQLTARLQYYSRESLPVLFAAGFFNTAK